MGNIARVFLRDVKRLAKAPAAWSVVLFLIVLPSLYTWFNVAAFWNPYDNTGNLRVCVVNEDAGANDETLGHLDVGAQLVEGLQENDQLAWQFTTRDEALAEVEAGRAYAAFIIPAEFSADVATLTTGSFKQPVLEYYVNEKLGPVSPKITDTGATTLDTTINDTFFSTVSSAVATALDNTLGDSRLAIESSRARASQRIEGAIADVKEARQTLARFGETVGGARAKASSAKGALAGAQGSIDEAAALLAQTSDLVATANTGLTTFSAQIGTVLDGGSAKAAKAVSETTLALSQTANAIEAAKASLGIQPDGGGLATPDFSDVIALLEKLKADVTTDEAKARIDQAIATLQAVPKPIDDWKQLAQQLDDAAKSAESASDAVSNLIVQALATADSYRDAISGQVVPAISASLASIASTSGSLSAAVANQRAVVEQASATLDELDTTLAVTADALAKTDRVMADLETNLTAVKTDLASLSSASGLQQLLGEGGVDPDKVADFMMSPTQVTREELYPLNAYGSAMAPLFINLTLWIGVFMLMVIFRLEVDEEEIKNLTVTQHTFGRGLLLAIIAALQAVVCCVGCLFMGVQTANAALFITTAVIASLAYLAIQYTLSTTLQHVGKALCIILVFVQIPGATGLYPIEMTPGFFRDVYPLFPFTYGINAIRETIAGFYGTAWLSYIGVLLAFMIGFIVVGTLVRPYLTNLNRMFAREIEEGGMVIGESVQLPARRWRMSQVIQALSNHDEYRQAIEVRANRFMALYPKLIRGALIAGIAVPILSTAVLAALGMDKVVILTTWLVWFLLVVGYLITVEYLRDYLSHLSSLEDMSEDEMRALFRVRNRFERVQPLASPAAASGSAADAAVASGPAANATPAIGWRSGCAPAQPSQPTQPTTPTGKAPDEGGRDA